MNRKLSFLRIEKWVCSLLYYYRYLRSLFFGVVGALLGYNYEKREALAPRVPSPSH